MGDKFEHIKDSVIVNRSLVQSSFNRVKAEHGQDVADALQRLTAEVQASGNAEATENLDAFNEELTRPAPKKAVLRSLFEGILSAVPRIRDLVEIVEKIRPLFG